MRVQPLTIAEIGDLITVIAVDTRVGRPMVLFAFLLLSLGTAGIAVNAAWGKAYGRWVFDIERNPIVPAIAFFLVLGVAISLAATHLFLRPRTYTVDRQTKELRWGKRVVPLDDVTRVHAEQLHVRGALVDYWHLMVTRRSGEQLPASIATENGWLWDSTALALTAAIDAVRTGKPFVEPRELQLPKGGPTFMAVITWVAIAMVVLDALFFLVMFLGRDRWLPRPRPPLLPPPAVRP